MGRHLAHPIMRDRSASLWAFKALTLLLAVFSWARTPSIALVSWGMGRVTWTGVQVVGSPYPPFHIFADAPRTHLDIVVPQLEGICLVLCLGFSQALGLLLQLVKLPGVHEHVRGVQVIPTCNPMHARVTAP